MKNKVFLGGTCAQTTWREELMPLLNMSFFNPVVDDWTPEFQQLEHIEKEERCNIHFYLIRKEMTGVFSIAEVVDSAHTAGKRTILHIQPEGFEESQLKSLTEVIELVNRRGGIAYMEQDLQRAARVLNNCFS